MLRATYLELQFSRHSMIELVRTSLVLTYPPFNPLLPSTGDVLPLADDGSQFVVLSTAFLTTPGSTQLVRGAAYTWNFEWGDYLQQHTDPVPAHHCIVTQRIRVDVARRVRLAGGQLQDVEAGIVEGTIVVDMFTVSGNNLVSFGLQALSFTVETPDVDPRIVKALQSGIRFQPIWVPLPWGDLLGEPTAHATPTYDPNRYAPHVQNHGVACTEDLSVFALRIQVGGEEGWGLVSEWTDFHAGRFPNRLLGQDGSTAQWGVLMSSVLVESLTLAQTAKSLAAHTDDFRLSGGITTQWAPVGDTPCVNGSFHGIALIPCRPRYDVYFVGRIEVTAPNHLTTVSSVAWHGNTWDLALCEAGVGLGLGVIGAVAGGAIGGPLGGAIGFGIGFGVGFIGGMLFATAYEPDISTSACTQDGNTLTCTRTLKPSLSFSGLPLPVELVSAKGTEDGLVMTGTYMLPLIPSLQQTQLLVETTPFGYTELPVNCGNLSFGLLVSSSSEEAAQFTHTEATITIRYVDDTGAQRMPPAVTATVVSADAQNVYPPSCLHVVPYSDRTVIYVSPVLTQTTPAAYWAAPYGCTIRVSTIVATRTVSLAAPTQLSTETLARLRSRAQRALNDCLAKQRSFGKHGGKFDIGWLPDPPDEERSWRFWQVGVLGLGAHEQLLARQGGGRLLAAAHPDAREVMHLKVLTPGGADNRQLILHRVGGDAGEQPARAPDIRFKQTPLTAYGVLVPGGRVRHVSTMNSGGRLMAAVLTTTVVMLYDVTFANQVRGYFRSDADGVLGIFQIDGGVATWGSQGIKAWSFGRTGPRLMTAIPIVAMRDSPSGLLAETDTHVLGIDRSRHRAVSIGSGCLTDDARVSLAQFPMHSTPVALGLLHMAFSRVPESGVAELDSAPKEQRARSEEVPDSYAVQHYGIGSTLLVATADGRGLRVFSAGPSMEA